MVQKLAQKELSFSLFLLPLAHPALSGEEGVLHAGVLLQVQPHAHVRQLGGLVKHHHLVVEGQVHVRQAAVVRGRPLER